MENINIEEITKEEIAQIQKDRAEEELEGCPDCGSTDIKDEGERCAECSACYAEHRRDALREDEIINNIKKDGKE